MASNLSPAFLPPCYGKMDADKLAQLYEDMFFIDVPLATVRSAIASVCGAQVSFADQHQLVPVLQTIHDSLGMHSNICKILT